jgi:coenzyme F420-reducing hydrogenase beta subunit
MNGASGGLVTWALCQLLANKEVDHVIAVMANPDPEKLFKYYVASSPKEVQQCSKSAYYPVEINDALKYVQNNEGRYVIVALPCMAKAIRNAQSENAKLKDRIKYIFGLVCGQQKSKHYTSHIANISGCSNNPVKVSFREKDGKSPANNFLFKAVDKNGNNYTKKWIDGVSKVWVDGLYKLPSCFYCDDIFAECADVTFMDAWLPEFSNEPKGTSIILNRKAILSDHFNGLSKISISQVIESQKSVILSKRTYLKIDLFLRKFSLRKMLPEKRVSAHWVRLWPLLRHFRQKNIWKKTRKGFVKSV